MIVIAGPTASGKTDLAVALARRVGGEVVSADSRQVYRELSAGTAKPRRDPAGCVDAIPYHMVDCASLSESFDAGRFALGARACISDINKRGLVPIIAGGTGLYIRALLEGLCELPRRDEALRRRLEEEARIIGRAKLHERLAKVDAQAAAAIPANNIQRVMRALEIFELTGRGISSHWQDAKTQDRLIPALTLRLDWPAEVLRLRIRQRCESMWPAMLEETRGLLRRFSGQEPGWRSLGYPQAIACVKGELSSEEGLRLMTQSTCAYAKRQRTWFRHQIAATPIAGGQTQDMLELALRLIPASITDRRR